MLAFELISGIAFFALAVGTVKLLFDVTTGAYREHRSEMKYWRGQAEDLVSNMRLRHELTAQGYHYQEAEVRCTCGQNCSPGSPNPWCLVDEIWAKSDGPEARITH